MSDKATNYTELKYGVSLEKISSKLRRLALMGAFPHKKQVEEIANASIGLRNSIQADESLDVGIKTDLTVRVDTLVWFMHAMLEEAHDIEKIQANLPQQEERAPDYLE